MTAPAGIPDTVILTSVGAATPSGIAIDMGPDENETVVGAETELVNESGCTVPTHIVADAGFTTGIIGVTVSVAIDEKSVAVQIPCITARNWYPFQVAGTLVSVSVVVVAPENIPLFGTTNHDNEAGALYSHCQVNAAPVAEVLNVTLPPQSIVALAGWEVNIPWPEMTTTGFDVPVFAPHDTRHLYQVVAVNVVV